MWIVTPNVTLANSINKTSTEVALNISTWQKKLYRDILHGQCRILNKQQQRFVLGKITETTCIAKIDGLIQLWGSQQEAADPINNLILIKYQTYLAEHKLTDNQSLWQNIMAEMQQHKHSYLFYGFAELKPNMEALISKLALHAKCSFHYPILKNQTTSLVQHESEAAELEWLRQNIPNKNTLIVCPQPELMHNILASSQQPLRATNSINLTSTLLVQSALTLLKALLVPKLKRSVWLECFQHKFINDPSLNAWHASNKSLLIPFEAEKMLNPEILVWHHLLLNKVKDLPKTARFSQWHTIIQDLLVTAGWPFVDTVTTNEQTLLNFWSANFNTWAIQDVFDTSLVSFAEAIDNLEQTCQKTSFRVQHNPNSQQALATLSEIDGHIVDTMIVLGANNKLVANDANACFARWRSQAKHLIFSQATMLGSEPTQTFAPLIAHNLKAQIPSLKLMPKPQTKLRPFVEQIEHCKPEKLNTTILNEYAKCPIKAVFNLMCKKHKTIIPANELSELNILRGLVVHEVLASFWQQVQTSSALAALSATEISARLVPLIEKALNQYKQDFASIKALHIEIEQTYILKLITNFLIIELARPEFSVVQIESQRQIKVLDYTFSVRLDRVDAEADGLHLIDYKTGSVSPSSWLGEPPAAPQMPLYLLDLAQGYNNVSYACLNKNFIGYKGYDNLKQKPTWTDFVTKSNEQIIALVTKISQGLSKTAPITPQTCNNCNLQMVCRPHNLVEVIDS